MGKINNKVGNTVFYLDEDRFSHLKAIGKGSYGVVVSALDCCSNQRVAIKKIAPMAKHTIDAKHILREIRIMRHMGRHENIIKLEDLIVDMEKDELYIVMELLDSDLHRVIQSKQNLTENHFRYFMMQILCGLKYLHENRIIHRDLKPGNLLVTRDCKLRITDFGLARERPVGNNETDPDDDIEEPMTEHVVTRWYRPPELMLVPDGMYTYAVDLWSVGCIFAEMLGRKPLFPGKNFVDQLTLIFDIIGSPLEKEVSHVKNGQARKYLSSQRGKIAVPLEKVFPKASRSALALLENLLLFSPERRLTVDEALATSFLAEAIDKDSPSMIFPSSDERFEFEFERDGSSKETLKEMIYAEAQSVKLEALRDIPNEREESQANELPREAQPRRIVSEDDSKPRDTKFMRAQEWLSAAAEASKECQYGSNRALEKPATIFEITRHSSASRQIENIEASARAMETMRSPQARKRRPSAAGNPRTCNFTRAQTDQNSNSVRENKNSQKRAFQQPVNRRYPENIISGTRKPPTVARSPKFSVLSRKKEKPSEVPKVQGRKVDSMPLIPSSSRTAGKKMY